MQRGVFYEDRVILGFFMPKKDWNKTSGMSLLLCDPSITQYYLS